MGEDLQIRRLLEQSLESGLTPEEVCTFNLDLLPKVRQRWERCRQIEAELDSLFSTSDQANIRSMTGTDAREELPRIDGYCVESVLGRGGVGVVFKARELGPDREVALKMLLAGANASPLERARFLRETHSVSALKHANIIQIHDVGQSDGLYFFTMEFLEGGTLAARLAGAAQPVHRAAALTATLADAIACAHDAGIIHRDLKPANVLLTAEGVPKVSDFGLARQIDGRDALTLAGMRMGTPSYMAPEQATGAAGAVGPAADIHALGALLYEMLTGRPPFRGASSAETVRQLISEEPVPPSHLNLLTPPALQAICLKCLQKDPRKRYSSANTLAEDLRHCSLGDLLPAASAR
jgi:eukaryotic-like serine/threonine-protein kinase